MMSLVVFSFTEKGSELNKRIVTSMAQEGYPCEGCTLERFAGKFALKSMKPDLKQWIGTMWGKTDFVFIGAAGIAVRMIAPWVKDKFTDSAVVVLDERGDYVVPLLSGHMGGAIEIAGRVASYTGGTVVLTTATDVQRKFAVDVFAKKTGLVITDRELAKKISAAVRDGKRIGFFSEYEVEEAVPPELAVCANEDELVEYVYGIAVKSSGSGQKKCEGKKVLELLPRNLVVGIGCRKGKKGRQIQEGMREILERICSPQGHYFRLEQIAAIVSIDLKKEEAGIVETANVLGIPFYTFSAQELREVDSVSTSSAFVTQITGVDNVCERAVRRFAPEGEVLLPKTCLDGMTFAVGNKQTNIRM